MQRLWRISKCSLSYFTWTQQKWREICCWISWVTICCLVYLKANPTTSFMSRSFVCFFCFIYKIKFVSSLFPKTPIMVKEIICFIWGFFWISWVPYNTFKITIDFFKSPHKITTSGHPKSMVTIFWRYSGLHFESHHSSSGKGEGSPSAESAWTGKPFAFY